MDLTMALYLIDVLSTLKSITGFLFAVLIAAFIITGIIYLCTTSVHDKKDHEVATKAGKIIIVLLFIFGVPSILIPTTATMYTMAGSYAVGKVLENPKVQVIQDKVLDIINNKLDELSTTKEKK